MGAGAKCAMARAVLVRAAESARQSSVAEKAGALVRTGYLATGKTLAKIASSHAIFGATEELPVRALASAIDYVRAVVAHATVHPELSVDELREVPGPMRGAFAAGAAGFREGLQKSVAMMKTTVDPDRLTGDFDEHGVHFQNPIIERAVQQVGAAHGAVYKPFWQWAFNKSAYYQSYIQSLHEGLTGNDALARARVLYAAPTDETVLRATEDANYAAFQNRTAVGEALSRMKSGLRDAGTSAKMRAQAPGASAAMRVSGQALYLGSQVLLPFTQIPTALAGVFVDYSPVGLAKTLIEQLPVENRSAARLAFGVARAGYGSLGLFGLGYALAKAGKMTGSYPTSPAEQAEWAAEGKQENSLLVHGRWYNLQPLEPVMFMAIMGANVEGAKQKNPRVSAGNMAATAVASMGKTMADQPYLMGTQQLMQGLEDPGRYGPRLASGLLPMPPILGQIARGTDPNVRQATSILTRLQAQTPGLSRFLPPRVDQFGRPEVRPGGLAQQLLNPATATTDRGDAVTQELDRLNVYPGMPGKNLTIGKQKVTRSPAELNQTLQQFGPILQDVLGRTIQSPGYQALDDDQKKLALEKIFLAIRGAENAASKGRILPTVQKFGQNPNPYYKGPTP